ncbi:hypothetical protein ASG43_08135 [Aureimonas sp. Leaf454]|uniref:hypothetical protein n=1 Tax=Aureimonas sp. Leaf454 TaxID=1736381 RepID=UPI0006FC6F2C|nr:hypothetical protein [Aureimonas sp. Leaf454]KQT48809.1 hypothetical protein ASG43_08135 [Aureimonas sp. Leaf454]
MKHVVRLLAGLASRALTIVLIVGALLFLAMGTGAGRDALRQRSEAIATRLLGTGFTAELGRQSFGIGSTGTIEIRWRDIRLAETGTGLGATKVARLTVGLRPLALLSGRLAIRSLSMSGATIDLTRGQLFDGPRNEGPGSIDAVLKLVDQRLDAVARSGLDRVELSDITVLAPLAQDGGPFVARVDEAALDVSDNENMRLSARFGVDDIALALDGDASFDAAAKRLADLRLSLGPLDIGRIVPPAPSDDRLDQRPFASDVKLSSRLSVTSEPDDEARTVVLSLGAASGDVQTGRGHAALDSASLDLAYREGSKEAVLRPGLVVFDGVSMTLGGKVGLRDDGSLSLRFDVGDLRSVIGQPATGEATRTGSVALEGTVALAPLRLDVPTIEIKTTSGEISGHARVDLTGPDAMTEVRLASEGVSARDVKAFWPFNLAPNTRRWVLEHIRDAGAASDVVFALNMTKARLGEAFRPRQHPTPEEMRLTLDVAGIGMATIQSMAELEDVAGRIEVLGGDTTIRIDRAKVAGLPSIAATQSLATFVRTPADAAHEVGFKLAIGLTGEAKELLAVAARPPLDVLRTIDVAPDDVSGTATVTADVEFHLGDDVPKGQELKGYAVDVALKDASLSKPFEGRKLTGLSGPLSIVPGAVEGELKGEVDGLSSTIRFGQPFGPHPAVERRLSVDVELSGEEAARRVPALSGVLDGPIAARLVSKGGPAEGFEADVDLSGAGIALPVIGWRKGKGVAAQLSFDLLQGSGDTKLRGVRLKGEGFAASGNVVADAGGLVSADLADVAFNPGDDVKLKVRRADNGYSFELTGDRFDARPFLADLRASLGERAAKGRAKAARQLDAAVAIGRLTGFGGQELRDVSLNYAGSAGAIAALSMAGVDAGGGRFAIDVSPRGKDRSIEVRAADAGRLVDFGGIYGRMEGGAMALRLLGSSDGGYAGTFAAENFTLVDEPRLSRLVGTAPGPNSASLSQAVGAPLTTERADFSHASAGIVYGRDGLRVTDGIIRGPVFGSSFSGTVYDAKNRIDITGSFMPAYGLNGMFGKIPVLGQILGNGNEGGLIGITYRLAGAFESPKLEVNPISAIAPGIFRNIFAYGP